ncbi:MAG: HesA/MoeB/ThiF family protein [Maricaulaceae bacterium]
MTPTQIKRYARHLVLKEIGGPGQNKLLGSRLVIVGAGGLGGPAALYAAAAGIGHITIIDDDAVDISNLQRQIQFSLKDLEQPKAQILTHKLAALNSDLTLKTHNVRLTKETAHHLLEDHDIIMDGTDSFETRFLINQASYDLKIPLISGALGRFDGHVGLFNSSVEAPCYQCFVPDIPPNAETCSDVGVVGAIAGVIGSLMALETVKHITGAGQSLEGHIYLYDGLKTQGRRVGLPKDLNCSICNSPK